MKGGRRGARRPPPLRTRRRSVGAALLGGVGLVRRGLDQGVDGRVERLGAGEAEELVADDTAMVEEVQRRPAVDVELAGDRPAGVAAVPPRPPGDLLRL